MYSIAETKITVSGDCSSTRLTRRRPVPRASLSVDESAITLAYKCIETTGAGPVRLHVEETGCEANGVSLSRNGKGSGVDHCGCFYLNAQKRTSATRRLRASASESSYYKGTTWRTWTPTA